MAGSALEHLRSLSNLEAIWKAFWQKSKSKETSGVDGVTIRNFSEGRLWRLLEIKRQLEEGYQFSPLRGVALPKKEAGSYRLICIPTVSDRIVQRAVLNVIESRAEKLKIVNDVSYGFVKSTAKVQRGTHAATIMAVKHRQAKSWVFKADISKFFDNIDRVMLWKDFSAAFRMKSVSPLVLKAINCEVQVDNARTHVAVRANGIVRGRGLRQGMPLSPILSNFVLRKFDQAVASKHTMIRYADDIAVFACSQSECEDAATLIKEQLYNIGLELSETKTVLCQPDEPVEFLGMELSRETSGKYGLYVSRGQMLAIRSSFRALHSWDEAKKECQTIGGLLRRLEAMSSGYASAYSSAANFNKLNHNLKGWQRACALSVYRSLFGDKALEKVTPDQRAFLQLP